MTNKKHWIHYLLAFCIGLMSLSNASAVDDEFSASRHIACPDCGAAQSGDDIPCPDQTCDLLSRSCGSHTGTGFLPSSQMLVRLLRNPIKGITASASRYRQTITEPIYRPPIA